MAKKAPQERHVFSCCYDFAINDFAFSVRSLRSFAAKSVWIMERRSRGFSSPDYRDSAASSHRQLPATKGTNLHPTPPITNPLTVKPFLSGAPLPTSGKNRMNGKEVDT